MPYLTILMLQDSRRRFATCDGSFTRPIVIALQCTTCYFLRVSCEVKKGNVLYCCAFIGSWVYHRKGKDNHSIFTFGNFCDF